MLMRTDPFRDFDRLAQQLLGGETRAHGQRRRRGRHRRPTGRRGPGRGGRGARGGRARGASAGAHRRPGRRARRRTVARRRRRPRAAARRAWPLGHDQAGRHSAGVHSGPGRARRTRRHPAAATRSDPGGPVDPCGRPRQAAELVEAERQAEAERVRVRELARQAASEAASEAGDRNRPPDTGHEWWTVAHAAAVFGAGATACVSSSSKAGCRRPVDRDGSGSGATTFSRPPARGRSRPPRPQQRSAPPWDEDAPLADQRSAPR